MSRKYNEILLGDCIEGLETLNSGVAQVCFADPPFNLQKKYSTYSDNLIDSEYMKWCEEWIDQLIRCLAPGGSLFLHNIPKWLVFYTNILAQKPELQFRHWISWDALSSPMGKSLQPAHYGILYYSKGEPSKVYELRQSHKRCRDKANCNMMLKDYGGKKDTIHPVGPLVSDVWSDIHRCKHDKYRDKHPCQLPVHLLERIILLSSDEGDLVVDPFMGSGTTALAAKKLGRKYFGTELSPEYRKIAKGKLAQETSLSQINGIYLSVFANRLVTVRDEDIYDQETKTYKKTWKSLFQSFPETKDDFRDLNKNPLKFSKAITQQIKAICDGAISEEVDDDSQCGQSGSQDD